MRELPLERGTVAANGYVVVMINPRGSTGYGQAIVDGVNGDWGGKPFSDLMLGLDEAEKKFPFIDKNREAAWARATAATWPTGCWATRTASSASFRTTACSTRIGLRDDRGVVVQRVGVQGASVGLLRQAGRGKPFRKWSPPCRPGTSRRPRW